MSNLNDPTVAIGSKNQGFVIHFVHVPTMTSCNFKAFLTAWEDNFKQDWNSYDTVGRMDPIRTFKRTSRIINFAFDIPSADKEEAAYNLNEIQKLIQMSYPTFNQFSTLGQEQASESKTSSTPIAQKKDADTKKILDSQKNAGNSVSHMVSPPFLRVKFSNWLNDSSLDPNMSNNDAYGSPSSKNNSGGSGLYGTIENVKFAPDLSENGGFYGPGDLYKTFNQNASEKTLIPKLLKLDITFNVLHTNDLGFYASSGQSRTPSFPYNANRILNKIQVK
jgi:hypothetical protein